MGRHRQRSKRRCQRSKWESKGIHRSHLAGGGKLIVEKDKSQRSDRLVQAANRLQNKICWGMKATTQSDGITAS